MRGSSRTNRIRKPNRKAPGDSAVDQTFDEFLKTEYSNIAQAHFNTSQSISEFFKAYIAVVSLPVSAAVIFLKPKDLKDSGLVDFLLVHPLVAVGVVGAVTVAGLLVLGYVVNLRCDAILYARTVNGIRRYFYEVGGLDLETELRYRVLPKRTHTPRYWETYYFLFVVLAFAAVGTTYWAAGLYFYYRASRSSLDWAFWALLVLSPVLHLALYRVLSRYRERGYLKSRILGVDIDGVLNDHRTQFCQVLADRTGKALDPAAIVRIPVHEIPNCGVNADDERAVFNWPSYWTTMPEIQGAEEVVKKIRNELGYSIWIFTYRPWPQPARYPVARAEEYRWAWEGASYWSRYALHPVGRCIERWLGESRLHVPELLGPRPIRSLTKSWLAAKGIDYNKLIIERGNLDTRDPLFFTRNRFAISAERQIRAFVEDDLNKATRLADVCEVVFLIDQPYNQTPALTKLPKNVIRVKAWQQLYEYLRRVL